MQCFVLAAALVATMPPSSIGKSSIGSSHGSPSLRQYLCSIDGCTKTALSKALQALHKDGSLNIDIANFKRISSIKRKMREPLDDLRGLETPYGKLLQYIPTGIKSVPNIEICNPFAYLYHVSSIEPSCSKLLHDATDGGNRMLHIVLYMDSINPGNPLRHDKGRTTECVYWTIAEFPDHVLVKASGWLVFSTIRTTLVEQWPGSFSGFMRSIINLFWSQNRLSPNFEKGIMVPHIGRSLIVRCCLGGILADEKALKEIFGLKGASGSKPCITCKNVIQFVEKGTVERSGTFWVGIDETDYRKLKYASSDDVYAIVDELRNVFGTVSKAKFGKMEQATGIHYDPEALLFMDNRMRQVFRPVEMCIRDPMHSLVSNGVAGTESARLIAELQEHGIEIEHLRHYVGAFTLPKAHGKAPTGILDANHVGDDKLRCFAGELLSLVPLLLAFLEDVIVNRGIMLEHHRFYKLLVLILAITICGPRAGARRSRELGQSIIEHHELYRKLFPECIKPKSHHLLHVEENINHIGLLLSCFVTERKHRSVKRAGLWTFRNYEHTLIADIVHRDIGRLQSEDLLSRENLLDPQELIGYRTSKAAHLPCGDVQHGDIIAYRGKRVLEVQRCWCSPNSTDIVLQGLSLIATEIDSKWRRGGEVLFVPVEGVVQACAWAQQGDSLRIVTPPSGFGWEP